MNTDASTDSMSTGDSGILDLSQQVGAGGRILEASLVLTEPQSRLRVRIPPGKPGRAEALLADRSWAAKHYWQESPGVVVYEFDEPLPAGPMRLRVPFIPASP